MSHTKTDAELEKLYKDGHGASHAHALRQIYQAGRADEAQALKAGAKSGMSGSPAEQAALTKDADKAAKRVVKNPGTVPVAGPTSQPGAATPAAEAGGSDDSEAEVTPPLVTGEVGTSTNTGAATST